MTRITAAVFLIVLARLSLADWDQWKGNGMTQRSRIAMGMGVWILLCAPASVSHANPIVFSNFGASYSYNIGAGNFVGNDFSGNNEAQGGAFTPSSAANFASLEIALSCFNCTNKDTLDISLDTNDAGVPGSALEIFSISDLTLGPFGTNNPPAMFTSVLMPLLTAGTPYWVTVSDPTGVDSVVWNWNDTGDVSDEAVSLNAGATWFAPSGLAPGAYEVDGATPSAVPEPWSLGLFTAGLLGLGAIRRRLINAYNVAPISPVDLIPCGYSALVFSDQRHSMVTERSPKRARFW